MALQILVWAGIIYNNIHNVFNPRNGIFSELAFLNYSGEIGNDYDLTVFFDNRFYIPVRKIMFLHFNFKDNLSGNPPFNLLSLMGGGV